MEDKHQSIKILYFFIVLLSIAITLFSILTADALGDLTDSLSIYPLSQCTDLLMRTILLYLLENFTERFVLTRMEAWIENKVYQYGETDILHKILHLPYDDKHLGNHQDLYSLVQSDMETMMEYYSDTLIEIIFQTVRLAITLCYILYLNAYLFLAYLAVTAVSLFVQALSGKLVRSSRAAAKNAEISMNTSVKDILSNRVLAKVYPIDPFLSGIFSDAQEDYRKKQTKVSRISMPLKTIGLLCGMLPLFGVCVLGANMLARQMVSASVFLSIFYMCQNIVPSQLHYADLIAKAAKSHVSVERIKDFLKAEERKENMESCTDITLKHVSYRYPSEEKYALQDITFTVQRGEKVALVGESGSGKSTVLKLIQGLIHPVEGAVKHPHSILMEQFPFLFHDSIQNNISFADEDTDSAKLKKAAKEADADGFIQTLDHGYETVLVENGSNLSGGQGQRIALARTFYTGADVYLFDEAISALDPAAAEKVIKTITGKKDKTVLFALHQKEYLKYFDRVLEFRNGKLVFDGLAKDYE